MSKYKLMKISAPGWAADLETINQVLGRLRGCICSMCMINTYEAMEKALMGEDNVTEVDPNYILMELESCCISEDYESFDDEGKVHELLGTGCGCEYVLEGEGFS